MSIDCIYESLEYADLSVRVGQRRLAQYRLPPENMEQDACPLQAYDSDSPDMSTILKAFTSLPVYLLPVSVNSNYHVTAKDTPQSRIRHCPSTSLTA